MYVKTERLFRIKNNIRLVARGQRGGKKESFFIHTKAF